MGKILINTYNIPYEINKIYIIPPPPLPYRGSDRIFLFTNNSTVKLKTMNYRLIMLDKPILVSDEYRQIGDLILVKGASGFHTITWCAELKERNPEFKGRLISGIESLPKLDLSIVADEIGWVDVEKLAIESIKKGWGQLFMRDDKGNPYGKFIGERPYPTKFWHDIDKWVEGFKAAQSLNEKKYTLSELELAIDMAREGIRVTRISEWETEKEFEYSSEQIIRHLSKTKEYLVEVEMEYYYMSSTKFYGNESTWVKCSKDNFEGIKKAINSCPLKIEPKITNNTITVTKILK